eukprot:gb/GECH01009519.1/.p1 GENE.gb/GECH01009519.1/~~gb/GECH01009519.1/.p1  ORF type:complete len:300 (+),score=2.89 gb/GECH01009519.1/:1-900(+)
MTHYNFTTSATSRDLSVNTTITVSIFNAWRCFTQRQIKLKHSVVENFKTVTHRRHHRIRSTVFQHWRSRQAHRISMHKLSVVSYKRECSLCRSAFQRWRRQYHGYVLARHSSRRRTQSMWDHFLLSLRCIISQRRVMEGAAREKRQHIIQKRYLHRMRQLSILRQQLHLNQEECMRNAFVTWLLMWKSACLRHRRCEDRKRDVLHRWIAACPDPLSSTVREGVQRMNDRRRKRWLGWWWREARYRWMKRDALDQYHGEVKRRILKMMQVWNGFDWDYCSFRFRENNTNSIVSRILLIKE